jgi:hypothetical protein
MEAPVSELGPEARAVVEAGRAGDEPTASDRARNRAALMAAIAAGGAATAVAEAAAASGAAKVTAAGAFTLGWGWKAIVVGLAVAGAVGTGVALTRSPAGAPSPTSPQLARPSDPAPAVTSGETSNPPTPPDAPARADAPAPVPKAPDVPARAPQGGSPRAPAPTPAGRASAEPRDAEPGAPPPRPADTLAGEMGGLREAHGALQGGDPARALSLLDAQSATYADGQLRQERDAARVTALCKLGKKDEARAAAARFLSENPRSVLADRVRNACADGAPR